MIDLRSDTVTKPTEAMRKAMAEAIVGDDVYGDDPTVNRLQDESACLTSKEAALFVPSGTMGNQLAIMAHTQRGDEIIVDENSHILGHEVGASAVLSGVNLRAVASRDGVMQVRDVFHAFRDPVDIHVPRSRLLCLENAHGCGAVLPLNYMRDMRRAASELKLAVHLDGARLFNAASVLGCEASDITQHVDTVMFCLSKGLCAPVGSLLCGPKEFIARARKYRKMLGGGMRQAGVLAAAGLLSLSDMRHRLHEDHATAMRLYEGIVGLFPVIQKPKINMVYFHLTDSGITGPALQDAFDNSGILFNPPAPDGEVRLVTHNDISEADVDMVISVLKRLAG